MTPAPNSTRGPDGAQEGRDESPQESADRMWSDLVQEVRIAQAGAQIVLGVLIIAAFQPVFGVTWPAPEGPRQLPWLRGPQPLPLVRRCADRRPVPVVRDRLHGNRAARHDEDH
ncbi:DUF6328 family protein [Streptomyces sp. NPDC002566]|uniref:DUF6328 family protein n=1 Tax=Streptomyces sp. NPDC002566 TaxID=3364650 RepID=UPI00369EF226